MARRTPEKNEARILRRIAERGLHLERHANYVRIRGPGIDITAASLEFVDGRELRPAKGDAKSGGPS